MATTAHQERDEAAEKEQCSKDLTRPLANVVRVNSKAQSHEVEDEHQSYQNSRDDLLRTHADILLHSIVVRRGQDEDAAVNGAP